MDLKYSFGWVHIWWLIIVKQKNAYQADATVLLCQSITILAMLSTKSLQMNEVLLALKIITAIITGFQLSIGVSKLGFDQ